jgi:predicted nucleic-acid-binding Zn-ribbon protein
MDTKNLSKIVSIDIQNNSWVIKCPSCGRPLFGFPINVHLNEISDFLVKNNDVLQKQISQCPQCYQKLSYDKATFDNKD